MPSVTSKIKQALPIILLLCGLVWIWLSRAEPGETSAGSIPAPQKGFQAPDFILETSTGGEMRLSDLRGQVVLLNFWASWCPPCRAEMPAFERTYQDLREQGFIILAVNATSQDSTEQALEFTREYGLNFPILFDLDGSVNRLYQVRSLPTSFFIDSHGVIQEVVIGGPMSEALLRIRVQQLLEGTLLDNSLQEAP